MPDYNPRMPQMTRMASPFDRANQPFRWWDQPPPPQPQQRPDDDAAPQPANQPGQSPKQPPSLLDMMMGLGRMTRPQYDKAIAGQGGAAQGYGMVSPWAFLGSMGMPGGAGWGGGKS